MMNLLDRTPIWVFAVLALGLGIAPPGSQPHLVEKLIMLANGTLSKPIDIFDLFLHGIFPLVLVVKLVRMYVVKRRSDTNGQF